MNRAGQAVIEALICGSVLVTGLMFLFFTGFKIIGMTLLDDWTDELLFCRAADCESRLSARLKLIGVSTYQVERNEPEQIILTAHSNLLGKIKISKESAQ